MRMQVKLRRGDGWNLKPEAEQLDGKVFDFCSGWEITKDDSSIYAGEHAWVPDLKSGYPLEAPAWIASGDLEPVH